MEEEIHKTNTYKYNSKELPEGGLLQQFYMVLSKFIV